MLLFRKGILPVQILKYCSTSVGNNLMKCFMQCTVLLDTALRAGTYLEMEFLNGIFIRGF
jgi:hypothetical protein